MKYQSIPITRIPTPDHRTMGDWRLMNSLRPELAFVTEVVGGPPGLPTGAVLTDSRGRWTDARAAGASPG